MPNADENAEKQELSLTAGGKAQWYPATLEHGLTCHKAKHSLHMQPSNHTPRNLSNAFEDLHPHKQLHENVYRSFIHNSQIETISTGKYIFFKKKKVFQELPYDPVVKTLCFHCWGLRFNPWSGKFHATQCSQKKKKSSSTQWNTIKKKKSELYKAMQK